MPTGPTLYDVLGVRSNASAEELRRAYRERARELHPDRHIDDDERNQASASRRMQELTAAWRVLGDAARRRRYDYELDLPSGDDEPEAARFVTRSDGTLPEIVEPFDGTARLVRALPWVALALVLVVIFVFSAYALTGAPKDGMGNGTRIGTCVTFGTDDNVTPVGCDAPSARQIVMLVGPSNSCPEGTDRRQPLAGSAVYCLRNP